MSRRILLADDSVTIQKVIELTFMDDDYEVRAVGNGDEAIAMLTALRVDFVIADVHMPGASGYEVCRRSKGLRPEVPVLLLVGTFEPFDEAQARECGADSYLKKPFDSQELLGRVHDLLGASGGAPAAAVAAQPAVAPPERPAAAAAAATAASAAVVVAAASSTASLGADPGAAGAAPATASGLPPAAAPNPPGAAPGPGQEVRRTGEIEAAASWQEFELEAEPELIPDPWDRDALPPSPPAAAVPPAVHRDERPFALGDLEEPEPPAAPLAPAAAPAAAADSGTPATAAAPVTAAAPASGEVLAGFPQPVLTHEPAAGQPFTLGEPLDDHAFLLDEAEEEAAPAAAPPTLRATVAEPVSPFPAPTPKTPPPASAEPAAAPRNDGALLGSLEEAETRAAEHAGGPALEAPAPGESPEPAAHAAALGDHDVDRIARRVVELLGDKVVRDVAWEVIPDLAEVVIKDRLRELESQIE